MVYLSNITDAQTMYVPKIVPKVSGPLILKVRNTVNQTEAQFIVIDLETSETYYRVAVALPEGTQSGEYEYELSDEHGQLSTGILVVSDAAPDEEYINTIQYEQYE